MKASGWRAGAAVTALFALALAGCQQRESIAAGEAEPKVAERQIDWKAAEAAKQREAPGAGLAQTATAAAEEAAAIVSPVPVLAPPPSVSAAAAGLADAEPTVRPTADGYFAVYPGAKYDMSVHGTKAFAEAPATAPQPTTVEPAAGGYRFEVGEGQAQIAFSRFGADYLIEFQCKGDLSKPCVDEAEAIAMAEKLLVVGRP